MYAEFIYFEVFLPKLLVLEFEWALNNLNRISQGYQKQLMDASVNLFSLHNFRGLPLILPFISDIWTVSDENISLKHLLEWKVEEIENS